jgi:deazaflavin-dependent oxidoreductase (nitroreductase family)
MTEAGDFNASMIQRFRENAGDVGSGAAIVLLHHRGRRSGKEYVAPLAYLRDDDAPDTIYVFASAAGAPKDPDWYHNLVAVDRTEIEVGPETYVAAVEEITGPERDRIYAEQAHRLPNFGDYEKKTEGIRTIPVVALLRIA